MQTLHEQEPTVTALPALHGTQQELHTPAQEHTTLPQITRKKIVSKGAYATQVGNKAGTSVFGLILLFFCLVGAVTTLVALDGAVGPLTIFTLVGAGLAGGGTLYLGYLGGRTIKEAVRINTGIPLTRANAADLPAPESLVRASSEPLQAQEAVLLRAAAEGMETPPEQLVRAVNGQEISR